MEEPAPGDDVVGVGCDGGWSGTGRRTRPAPSTRSSLWNTWRRVSVLARWVQTAEVSVTAEIERA